MQTSVVIKLTMAPGEWRRWRPLLWQGFRLKVQVGVSVEDLLIGELGINREFVENKVRTVFLNGCPVDELSTAIVEEGSQIALGGSMPGMVGIAMQRHSPAGFVRQEITYPKAKTRRERKRGSIAINSQPVKRLLKTSLAVLFSQPVQTERFFTRSIHC